MNAKNRIIEKALLSLAVVIIGGIFYYSMLTDNKAKYNVSFQETSYPKSAVKSNVKLNNRTYSGIRSQSPSYKGHVKNVSGGLTNTAIPSFHSKGTQASHSLSGAFSGNDSYFQARKSSAAKNTSSGATSIGMLAYDSRGYHSSDGSVASARSTTLSAVGATSISEVPQQQNAPNAPGDIIIDPGGDPTGPPIPVGDGMYVMMMLIGLYSALVFYKKRN